VLITANHGVVVVDTKNPGWGPSILTAVQAITDQPVTTIINTHAHGDHVGSNPHFAEAVRIVAHENARATMAGSELFTGGSDRFLPNETFQETLSLFEGLDQIDLYHVGPAHTNGDTIVVFPALATAHVGDLFPRKAPPFIDRANGGSGVAYPDTLASALARIADVNRVMPGHAPPPTGSPVRGWTTWDDFREYAAFTRDLLDAARAAFEAGRSVDEAVAGLDLQPRYPDYDLAGAGRAVQAIYDELGQ
jgi:glyoxylase-like metal-dependent hydrolase (beta-lactamase superfamily II)